MAPPKKSKKGSGKRKSKRSGTRKHTPVLESKPHMNSDMPAYPSYRRKRKRRPIWRDKLKQWVRKLWLPTLTVFAALVAWLAISLPDIDDLNAVKRAPSIVIKSESGSIIGSFGEVYGEYVAYKNLPASLIDAVIATEDRNFYHHFGIDPVGLVRALVVNMQAGHVVQGGSTITQQVAKNVFLTPERSMSRKIKEMVLALQLEWHYSKAEIMSIYLNRVYLGAGSYGVDAASRRYFGKPAQEMTLSESAIIAGLLKAPSRFAPTSNPALAKSRAMVVLSNMQAAGYLTEAQVKKAQNELNQTMKSRRKSASSTQYFADWVLDQLPDYVGELDEDLEVVTTLDPEWQALAEKAISEAIAKEGAQSDVSQAAMLSMTPDGAVRAMVGGVDYADSQYNRATQALRQPGSAFKLFVFLAGLEDGMSPSTVLMDEPISIRVAGGSWKPKNYTGRFEGEVTMREAVAESINTVAVQVAMRAGLDNVIEVAERLGISSEMEPLPSVALGATEVSLIELTSAYAHLASNGGIVYPYGITKIVNNKKKVLYEREVTDKGRVLSGRTVGMMNEMLMGVMEHGTGRGAAIGRSAAGKTGTTSDYRDAWFIGYTPALVTGVWVGNDDNQPMKKVTGGGLPSRIWRSYMAAALSGLPAEDLPTGGLFDDLLPWQDNDDEGDEAAPPASAAERGGRKNVELGPSFWNKLFR